MMITGTQFYWSTECDVKMPIVNLPKDALSVKIRKRFKREVYAFVRCPDRVEMWILGPVDGGSKLLFMRGANVRPNRKEWDSTLQPLT